MAPPILTLKNIHLTFGSTPLLEGAEMSVQPGARLCLVGRNGSGKSTLLKIAAGQIEPDDGERFIKPGTTVRYLAQDPDLSGFETSRDFIEDGQIGTDASSRIPYLLDALGLTGLEDPAHMSGGEAKRAALARVLAAEPDLLMLDEPTNHLDLPIIEWLEGTLAAYPGALLLISHDRRFLSELTDQTLWVDRGETRLIDEGFGAFEDWRDTFLEQEELERHKLGRKIAREQHWIVHGVSGRRKRNVRRVKELAGLRSQKANEKQVVGKANVSVADGQTSGKRVAELHSVSQTFQNAAGEKTVIDDFSIKIARGDRIGLVGPNGSGKTTLLKIITGALSPDQGTVELGTNLQPLILDQKREGLDPETTLRDALTGGGGDSVMVNGEQKHVIGYMKDFLFAPEQQRTPIHALSGGERARVELARGLRLPSNLLVLDEPTNDLDLETLDLLQELIADYNGTVLLVSHDRDFLDRTVDTTVNFEGEGKWTIYAGGYSDMQRQKKKAAKAAKAAVSSLDTGTQRDKKSTAAANTKKAKPKLSYKHKYALETLPGVMKQLEADIARLTNELADPKLYQSDPAKFKKTADKLESKKADLEAKELEWLELEILREEAES